MSNSGDSEKLNNFDKQSLYDHWMKIWDIMPEDIRFRFRNENNCVLCEAHKAYLSDVQRQVRHDKMIKAAEMEKKEAEKKENN